MEVAILEILVRGHFPAMGVGAWLGYMDYYNYGNTCTVSSMEFIEPCRLLLIVNTIHMCSLKAYNHYCTCTYIISML